MRLSSSMSQESHGGSRRTPGKSPSMIPVLTSSSNKAKKRPAASLVDLTGDSESKTCVPTPKSLSSNFKRLQELAKADVEKRNTSQRVAVAGKSGMPWVEKHLPKSLDDLFVHKKKVEDVMTWMNCALTSKNVKRNKTCVISGPAGCGKTATVCLVAHHLEAEVKEWSNPMSLTQFREVISEDSRNEVQSRSQIDQFTDFLFRTSQYRSLPIKGKSVRKHRVILIEDIPNIFYRDTNVFHEVLRKYGESGSTPLVIIFTDSAASDHSLYRMLPKSLMTDLNIYNVAMNPVATTLMTKFLLDVCTRESIPVDRSQVEEVAATANGDLRCALNNLQFSLTKEKYSNSSIAMSNFRKPPNKRCRKQDKHGAGGVLSKVQQKDETIQLFRALGKVLYGKRDETVISENEVELVGEMEQHRRIHPLLESPENIGNKMEVSSETFLNFLHQNYPPFYGSADDMRNAAEYLADGDYILSGWKFDDSGTKTFKVRDVKEQVAMSTVIRGLMHSNNNRVSVGWKPLTKPLVSNLESANRHSVETTRQSLFQLRELQTTLFTEAIPFYAKLIKLKHVDLGVGTKEILEKGLFQHKVTRAVTLDEKETVEEDGSEADSVEADENTDTNIKVETETAKRQSVDLDPSVGDNSGDEEEEFVIEEFD